ncbi:hypothetical protein BT93_B1583 [Corymbia citriodora subsp. variegata]|nr:hypothetical protein BT93_B1583 [Corymbia citriodora subsp. variegata]
MGYDHVHRNSTATIVLISILVIVLSNLDLTLAARPLPGEGWSKSIRSGQIESLQRGPVPRSGSSSCTNIPGQNLGRCILSGINVAGSAFPAAVAVKI